MMESYSMEPVQGRKDHISQENPNPNDDQSKRKGTKRIIYRFFHYTTINGLQRMASSGTILGRLFWILVLLGAGGMFSRDIYTLVQQFFERPISVVSRVEYFRVRSRMIIFADVHMYIRSVKIVVKIHKTNFNPNPQFLKMRSSLFCACAML